MAAAAGTGGVSTLPTLPDAGSSPFPPGSFKEPKRLYCKNGGYFLRILPDGRVDGTREKNDGNMILTCCTADIAATYPHNPAGLFSLLVSEAPKPSKRKQGISSVHHYAQWQQVRTTPKMNCSNSPSLLRKYLPSL
ncbi:fibroblast growth factor 2 isoform X2 [Carcharodon carcharias]|uniref:fibroblast growth factor 2 isoform X2 n=1 Tax=Carcharodon carcharias TaxID=13397 RepID=UPI001B7DA003|nr:fibroblast growth factor 2 isoform X2 [Carcharodon carcharias]